MTQLSFFLIECPSSLSFFSFSLPFPPSLHPFPGIHSHQWKFRWSKKTCSESQVSTAGSTSPDNKSSSWEAVTLRRFSPVILEMVCAHTSTIWACIGLPSWLDVAVSYNRGPMICGSFCPLKASTPICLLPAVFIFLSTLKVYFNICDDMALDPGVTQTGWWRMPWFQEGLGSAPISPLQTGSRKTGWQSRTGSRNGSHHRWSSGEPTPPY